MCPRKRYIKLFLAKLLLETHCFILRMISAWKCFCYSRDESEKVPDGGCQLQGMRCEHCYGQRMCNRLRHVHSFLPWGVLSSQNSKSMSSLAYLDANGCSSFLPCITVKPYEENRKSHLEVKNLESKSSIIENSVEKIEKHSSSPFSYAEEVNSTAFTNYMKFQRPRYPLNGRS